MPDTVVNAPAIVRATLFQVPENPVKLSAASVSVAVNTTVSDPAVTLIVLALPATKVDPIVLVPVEPE
jgi:hypothetical protein